MTIESLVQDNQKQVILDVINLLKKTFELKDDDAVVISHGLFEQKQEIDKKIEELENKNRALRNDTQNQIQFIRKQRNELRRQQTEINFKLSDLNKKFDALNLQEQIVNEKIQQIKSLEANVQQKELQIITELERISGMTKHEALTALYTKIENDAKTKADNKAKQIISEAVMNAKIEAQKTILVAMQKEVSNVIGEFSTCAIELPDDNMKGKIIGREGRNIRTFEELTGVTVLIDDTPEMVVLSCYEPIRREIARVAMTKLICDSRIHPRRIEDLVEIAKKEVNDIIFNVGKETAFQFQLPDLHIELMKLIGRLRYRTSYSQNVLEHIKEVAQYAGDIADELKLDRRIATRAALLHDIGKSIDKTIEGSHANIGYDLAKKYNENDIICKVIAEHHDDEPTSVYTWIVKIADALSSSRPGVRHDTFEAYVKRLDQLENIANSFSGIKSSYAILAGRELRVAVEPELVSDDDADKIAENIKTEIERTANYPGQIKIIVIREKRHIKTAS